MADSVLVVDLDGTLYAGDGPVRRYAAEVAGLLGERATGLAGTVDAFLAGERDIVEGADGWEAVRWLAVERFGATPSIMDTAFLRTRRGMGDASVPVAVPAGFAELLAELRGTVGLVLATNSPKDGLLDLLTRLDVVDLFDEIVFSTGKPAGLTALLARLMDAVGATGAPWRICCLGDHWRNDIEPAYRLGAVTGYVDRFDRAAGPANVTAATLTELLGPIRSWAADPRSFAERHAVAWS